MNALGPPEGEWTEVTPVTVPSIVDGYLAEAMRAYDERVDVERDPEWRALMLRCRPSAVVKIRRLLEERMDQVLAAAARDLGQLQ